MQTLVVAESSNIEKQFIYAKKLYQDEFFDLSAVQFQEILDLDPIHPLAVQSAFCLAESYYHSDKIQHALKSYSLFIVKHPDSPSLSNAYYQLGKCYESMQETEKAIHSYLVIPDKFPRSPLCASSILDAAKLQIELNQEEKAIRTLHLMSICSTDIRMNQQAQLFLARIHIEHSNFADALGILNQILKKTNSEFHPDVNFYMGEIYLQIHQITKAIDAYEQSIQPQNPTPHASIAAYKLAKIYIQSGNFSEGQKYYQTALDLSTVNSEKIIHDYIQFLIINQNYQIALEVLQNINIDSYPDSMISQSLYWKAHCYKNLGDYNQAIPLYQEVRFRFPNSSQIRQAVLELAVCHGKNNKPLNAIKCYYDYIHLYPNDLLNPYLFLKTGKLYLADQYRISECFAYLSRVWQHDPIHPVVPEAYYSYAQGLLKTDRHKEAVRYLEMLIDQYPYSIHARFAFNSLDSISAATPVTQDSSKLFDNRIPLFHDAVLQDSLRKACKIFDSILEFEPLSCHTKYLAAQLSDSLANDLRLVFSDTGCQSIVQKISLLTDLPSSLFIRAQLALNKDDHQKAIHLFQNLIHNFPDTQYTKKAIFLLGTIYSSQNSFKKAIYLFHSQIENDSLRTLAASYSLIDSYQSNHQKLTQRLIDAYVGNAQFDFALNHLHAYRLLYINQEDRVFVNTRLANIAEKQNHNPDAVFFLESLANDLPSDSLYLMIGDIYLRLNQIESALTAYEKGTKESGSEAVQLQLHAGIILVLLKQNKIQKADTRYHIFKKTFAKQLKNDDILPNIELEFGMAYFRDKDFKSAEIYFEQLKNKYKKTSYAIRGEFEIGRTLLVTNHTDEALEILIKLTQKYPSDPILGRVYLNLGDHYFRSQQYQNAIGAFKKAIGGNMDPEIKPLALRFIVRVYENVGLYDAALAYTRQYISEYPYAEDIMQKHVQIGLLYFKMKDYYQAIHQLKQYQHRVDSETEAEVQYWISKSYLNMGQLERAISEFLKVKYISKPTKLPWASTAVYEAGRAYLSLEKPGKAKKLFEKVIQVEGTSELGRAAQQQIDRLETRLIQNQKEEIEN